MLIKLSHRDTLGSTQVASASAFSQTECSLNLKGIVVERADSLSKRIVLSLVRKAARILIPGFLFLIFKYLRVCLHCTLSCFK